MPGLVAAAALLTDYILTVAVSISGGVAAITSAYPALAPHTVLLCIAVDRPARRWSTCAACASRAWRSACRRTSSSR